MDDETIKQLDDLIEKLNKTQELVFVNIPYMGLSQDQWDKLCRRLKNDGWIEKPWDNNEGKVISIRCSNNFKSLLLDGNYSQRKAKNDSKLRSERTKYMFSLGLKIIGTLGGLVMLVLAILEYISS